MPSRIALVPVDGADDPALVARLVALVNAAYAIGEAGMWGPGVARVTPDEIAGLIRSAELLTLQTGDEVIGCVRVHAIREGLWGFGMLAVDPDRQSGGSGTLLVDASERHAHTHGARTMQLEVLVPTHDHQDSKRRLRAWYSSRGYSHVRNGALEDEHPALIAHLAVPCVWEIWQKPLPEEESP